MVCSDAAEAGFRGRARQQRRYRGGDARRALLAPVSLFTAPIALVLLFRHRGKPEGFVPRSNLIWWLALILAVSVAVGWRRSAKARSSVTWGCGYTAGTARMQYTGSSFAAQLSSLFRPALPVLTREQLPTEPFPQQASHLSTNHVDAVERRMFEVLGQGEQFVQDTSGRIPEQPRFAFAAGLLVLVIVALVAIGQVS